MRQASRSNLQRRAGGDQAKKRQGCSQQKAGLVRALGAGSGLVGAETGRGGAGTWGQGPAHSGLGSCVQKAMSAPDVLW